MFPKLARLKSCCHRRRLVQFVGASSYHAPVHRCLPSYYLHCFTDRFRVMRAASPPNRVPSFRPCVIGTLQLPRFQSHALMKPRRCNQLWQEIWPKFPGPNFLTVDSSPGALVLNFHVGLHVMLVDDVLALFVHHLSLRVLGMHHWHIVGMAGLWCISLLLSDWIRPIRCRGMLLSMLRRSLTRS